MDTAWSYVLDFGKHKGKKLSEVPPDYMQWLEENALRPSLKEALATILGGSTSSSITYSWTPPALSGAGGRFYDYFEAGPIWVTRWDSTKLFKLDTAAMARLPNLNDKSRPKFGLYHVWDLAKTVLPPGVADRAVSSFLGKNKDVEEDIWGFMGLGVD